MRGFRTVEEPIGFFMHNGVHEAALEVLVFCKYISPEEVVSGGTSQIP